MAKKNKRLYMVFDIGILGIFEKYGENESIKIVRLLDEVWDTHFRKKPFAIDNLFKMLK